MNIQFIVFSNPQTGQGHYFRCETLAKLALERGHSTSLIGDRKFPFLPEESFIFSDYKKKFATTEEADWIVADLPFSPTLHARAKTCLLNGVGYELETNYDLVIIQGFSNAKGENVFSGSQFVILRSELADFKKHVKSGYEWFVWGGSEDKMKLLSAFPYCNALPYKLATNPVTILGAMSGCSKACVAMGMAVWELIYLNIPTYVFSLTKTHFQFAKVLHNRGLIKAWITTGIPERKALEAFLQSPFDISYRFGKPDLLGANRILSLLEEQL